MKKLQTTPFTLLLIALIVYLAQNIFGLSNLATMDFRALLASYSGASLTETMLNSVIDFAIGFVVIIILLSIGFAIYFIVRVAKNRNERQRQGYITALFVIGIVSTVSTAINLISNWNNIGQSLLSLAVSILLIIGSRVQMNYLEPIHRNTELEDSSENDETN